MTPEQLSARVIEIMARTQMGINISLLMDLGYKREQLVEVVDMVIKQRQPLVGVPK